MKRILSPLLLIFVVPISFLRKAKIDNFIGGLLIGAMFSLFVNLLTNEIGETITRQRSLEALELELNDHHFTSLSLINSFNSGDYKKGKLYTYLERNYADNIWTSLASTTYFYSLPAETQALLLSYYGTVIVSVNSMLNNEHQIVRSYESKYLECVFKGDNCSEEEKLFNDVVDFYVTTQSKTGVLVDEYDYNIQKKFHPTRDRLNDPLLRFLMGTHALKALSLPWKEPTQ